MNKLFLVLICCAVNAGAFADDWTCAGTCGYLDGNSKLVPVQPYDMKFGTGASPKLAYENAADQCTKGLPEGKKAYLITTSASNPTFAEPASLVMHCVKN